MPKRLTAARLAGVPELEEAFSDTTDTKDIWDGGGQQPPSVGRHVALLQESLLAMGYALPRCGVDGIYGDETTAAVTQLQIDAGHPWPPGQDWEHIGGIAGPNTMAHFDMFDPGSTVGNITRPETGVHATTVRFSESPDNLFAGFDETTSPPSLMVGKTTRRRVRVDHEPLETDIAFRADDPSIVTVGLTAEGIVIGGEQTGHTVVRATSGGEVMAMLEVTVKDAREEIANFFFVSDSSEPQFATAREEDKAILLALRLNRVFRRQANVHFTLGAVRQVVIPVAIGPTLTSADSAFLEEHAIAGQLNVFCVWSFEADGTPRSNQSIVVLPDADCPDGMTVPHGAAHFLSDGRADSHSGLTAPCDERTDRRRISRALADFVNP